MIQPFGFFFQGMLPQLPFMLLQCKFFSSSQSIFVSKNVKQNMMGSSMNYLFRVTFRRVIKKKSTEEFSCIPYIIALLNCLLYTWYGLPVVSSKWENFPVVTVNGVGIILELAYVLIYFWYATPKGKASPHFHKKLPLP